MCAMNKELEKVIKCKCGKCPKVIFFTNKEVSHLCDACYEKGKTLAKEENYEIPLEFKGIFLSPKEK